MMNNTLQVIEKAPVEIVTKEQVDATIAKIKVMVPDASKMNDAQLKHIAQESILFRTLPGKDVHYFIGNSGKLERVEDYKYLISFIENKERILTGDNTLKIKYQSRILEPQEKLVEGAAQDDFVVRVTVTTTRDMDAFRREVKTWMDLGLKVEDAIKATKETMGEAGVSAVGAVKKGDNNIPKGWTPLQKAEKLAIKNAIHKRWGSPTVDELSSYVRGMARLASPEDWNDVPLDLPAEVQARWADMNAITQDIIETSASMTIEEHKTRLSENVDLLRGNDNGVIGEDEPNQPITPSSGVETKPTNAAHWSTVAANRESIEASLSKHDVPLYALFYFNGGLRHWDDMAKVAVSGQQAFDTTVSKWRGASDKVRFYITVQQSTGGYYNHPNQLWNVIGELKPEGEERQAQLSLAVDHAAMKNVPAEDDRNAEWWAKQEQLFAEQEKKGNG